MNSKALSQEKTPEEKLIAKFKNILGFCGVRFEEGIIVHYPLPDEPEIKIDDRDEFYIKPKTIACAIQVRKGRVFLRTIETKHGIYEGKLINPAALLIATEIWRMIVTPAIERKKQYKKKHGKQ